MLCGISIFFASHLEVVVVVISNGFKLFVRHKCGVFDAAPDHTTLLPFLVSAVPTRQKNIQKVKEGETCVSSKLQNKRGRATRHESGGGRRLRRHVLETSASARETDVAKAAEEVEEVEARQRRGGGRKKHQSEAAGPGSRQTRKAYITKRFWRAE